jgi:RHS repeat-associated protein
VLGCLVGIGLVVGGVSPVWAAESGPADGSALVGGFGLGDGLEGSVDEPSGAFKIALPAGGLNLGWDSRALGADLFGLGAGWSFGLARIQVDGGVRVFPASGGSYPADASSPTGLGGYTLADTRFEQTPGVLPAEGAHPEAPYAYALYELGGSATYFDDAGDPVAHLNGIGSRTSWVWESDHRLVEVIDADGVATSLTWSNSKLVVRPGSNLPGGGEAWVVELKNDRVVAAVDPEGGRTQVVADPSGLIMQVSGESGARTTVEWRAHADGVTRVDRVITFGADDAQLSSRTWQPAGAGVLSSGWPAVDAGASAQGVAFAAKVGDGQSELESTYNALGSLVSRVMSGSTPSGRQVLQEQTFEYPGTDEHGVPTVPVEELPKQWANPSAATVTFRDAAGGERSGTQRSEFDEFGRLVEAARGNGVVTSYEHSSVNELTRETTTTNGVVTADRSYIYDQNGRLIERTDQISDGVGGGLTATTTAYTYDGFDRLTGSAVHDGDTTGAPVTRTSAYVNTVAGDIERETVTEHPGTADEVSTERAFEYDPAGALTAITTTTPEGSSRAVQEYDVNGNLTRDLDGTTYTYDAENRVTGHTTTAGVVTQVGYWADGTRRSLTTTEGGQEVSTGFYWDGDTLLNDTHTAPTGTEEPVTASYLIGAVRHARTLTAGTGDTVQVQGTSYLGTDRHGNTTDLTDEHGAVTTRYDYTDYGTTTVLPTAEVTQETSAAASAARNPFQYASAYADPAGTLHLDVRDYRPGTMRFDTPDVAKELTNYAYGDLNPITNVDPSGRSAIGDQLINGALVVWGLVTGIAAGIALGLPTGGMSVAATAWYVTAAVAIAGDLVSVGMATAQIIDAAGPRFIRDEDREGLRVSNIVIGTVAGFVSGGATYMYRARRAADAAADTAAKADAASKAEYMMSDGTVLMLRKPVDLPPGPSVFEGKKSVEEVLKKLSRRIDNHLTGVERGLKGVKTLDQFSSRMYTPHVMTPSKVVGRTLPPKMRKLKFNKGSFFSKGPSREEQWSNYWDDYWGGAKGTNVNKTLSKMMKDGGSIADHRERNLYTNAAINIREDISDAVNYIEKLRLDAAEHAQITAQRDALKALLG